MWMSWTLVSGPGFITVLASGATTLGEINAVHSSKAYKIERPSDLLIGPNLLNSSNPVLYVSHSRLRSFHLFFLLHHHSYIKSITMIVSYKRFLNVVVHHALIRDQISQLSYLRYGEREPTKLRNPHKKTEYLYHNQPGTLQKCNKD